MFTTQNKRAMRTLGFGALMAVLAACSGDEGDTNHLDEPSFAAATTRPFDVVSASSPRPGDAISRNDTRRPLPIRLNSRTLSPRPGIDPSAIEKARNIAQKGGDSISVLAQRASIPDPEAWESWRNQGLVAESYLGDLTWLLELHLAKDAATAIAEHASRFEAMALVALEPQDKTSAELYAGHYADWAYDRADDTLAIVVAFVRRAEEDEIVSLLKSVAAPGDGPVPTSDGLWSARIAPSTLRTLLEAEIVRYVEEGPLPKMPLLSTARKLVGAEPVQSLTGYGPPPVYTGYTGAGVRMSNGEGFDKTHDDFWNHDSAGNQTTPRWVDPSCANGDPHGTMTAGLMLGNGFCSAASGAAPYQYRGMAPGALFDCYGNEPNISNHSVVDTFGPYLSSTALIDKYIRGDALWNFHPAVGASGNQGIVAQYGVEKGYYSIYRNAKNEITVGNISSTDIQWNGSSIGPTWDGRLKPDLVAPGSAAKWPRGLQSIQVDIDYVSISGPNTVTQNWSFDATNATWHGGFGIDGWWDRQNIGPITQQTEGTTKALRTTIVPPPWGTAWANRPKLGTRTFPNGTTQLHYAGKTNDVVTVRYRLANVSEWNDAPLMLFWSSASDYYAGTRVSVPIKADGQWNLAQFNMGSNASWVGNNSIDMLNFTFEGPTTASPGGTDAYVGAGGSSASAPVVAGGVALLMEQITDLFNVDLDSHAKSPFWYGSPALGQPLPSTYKALLIHSADDLASIPSTSDPPNSDTGVPTFYHDGPDLVTGYGLLNVAQASRVLTAEAAAIQNNGPRRIIEREISTNASDVYTINVPTSQRRPLKVTLAWDDAPGDPGSASVVPKLVNNLDLLLKGPDGLYYYPYSIDPPYIPQNSGQYPNAIEPEPINAQNIKPARKDLPNNRDNVEQVVVEFPKAGSWQVFVMPGGLALPPQKYSLVMTPAEPPAELSGGRVVFLSSRTGTAQLYVKDVGSPAPPTQLSSTPNAKDRPEWSPHGNYIVSVDRDTTVGSQVTDKIVVYTPTGSIAKTWLASDLGFRYARYPGWSPRGDKILLTVFKVWGERGLLTLDFQAPYQFSTATTNLVYPLPTPGNLAATDASFSPDGRWIYFHGDSASLGGGLFRMPATGGNPEPIYGNTSLIRRAYHVSVSPDGDRLIFNSEMWNEQPSVYKDEEIVEVGLRSGVTRRVSFEPGNQAGWFAINGNGEYAMQSQATVGGKLEVLLEHNGLRQTLDVADPGNNFDDYTPSWWKPKTNLALGAIVTAQSTNAAYTVARVNDGNRSTLLGSSYSWMNAFSFQLPQWVEFNFGQTRKVSRVEVYMTQGAEMQDYDVQYWNGNAWATPVQVTGNLRRFRSHDVYPVLTQRVRILARKGSVNDPGFVRINEVEIY